MSEDLEIEDVDDESYYLRELSKLEKQLKEANAVICGLYHLVIDKKAASGVVCDYLVKYGKPFDVKSGV